MRLDNLIQKRAAIVARVIPPATNPPRAMYRLIRITRGRLQIAIQATFCAILAVGITTAQTATPDSTVADVLRVEAAFSEAKIKNDVAGLDRILADDYIGINQWGVRRDKQAALELFRTFTTASLVSSRVNVRVSGDTAVIDGMINESNQWKFLFLRTYVKRQGRWQLLSTVHTIPINPDTMTPIDPFLTK